MVKHVNAGVMDSGLPIRNMVQISMDGPNVNWKFFNNMKAKLADEFDTTLINIGSCGLHIIHNSFKTGALATEWSLSSLLSSMYYLFKDSPARREDYMTVTGSSLMPLKFVSHRWLENEPVCERALKVWNNFQTYVQTVKEKKVPHPGNKSFATVKEAVDDQLIKVKLHFFKCIAGHLQPFLVNYQTDKPMVCFLASDLASIIKGLMKRFIKDDVLSEVSTADKLVKVDVEEKRNHKTYKAIDIGFSAEKALKEAKEKAQKEGTSVSDKQVMEFRLDCRNFLIALLKKILNKCPISYSLVRNMAALNPKEMVAHPSACRERFKKVLTVLVSARRVKEQDCDAIVQQFGNFLDSMPVIGSDMFSSFNSSTQRVVEFFSTLMAGDTYAKLLDTVKLVLVLSHGQASVERGFSVNKEV